jgi:polyisoprenoid-binding protein YceI
MATWNIDPMHSTIEFKVKHLMITTVTGKFDSFTATVETSDDTFANAAVSFQADVNSISTGIADRDGHLKSDDFFNAESFPTLNFSGTSMTSTGTDTFVLEGDLTIRDVTKRVSLNVEFGGVMVDPYGNTKAGFEATGVIKRKEFGLAWDAVTEAGGIVVSDDVRLSLNVQLMKVA